KSISDSADSTATSVADRSACHVRECGRGKLRNDFTRRDSGYIRDLAMKQLQRTDRICGQLYAVGLLSAGPGALERLPRRPREPGRAPRARPRTPAGAITATSRPSNASTACWSFPSSASSMPSEQLGSEQDFLLLQQISRARCLRDEVAVCLHQRPALDPHLLRGLVEP